MLAARKFSGGPCSYVEFDLVLIVLLNFVDFNNCYFIIFSRIIIIDNNDISIDVLIVILFVVIVSIFLIVAVVIINLLDFSVNNLIIIILDIIDVIIIVSVAVIKWGSYLSLSIPTMQLSM